MRKFIFTILLVLCIIAIRAQERSFTQWAVGINGGLYGVGLQAATNLSPHFSLRAGFDYLGYSRQDVASFEAEIEGYEQYGISPTVEAEITKASITFPNFKLMLDYYPVRNGIFSLTGGFYFGSNSVEGEGLIHDYETISAVMGEEPSLTYEDIVFQPNSDGSFDALLTMGNSLKPYIGLGLGRTIPKNRVGVRFETGCGLPRQIPTWIATTPQQAERRLGEPHGRGARICRCRRRHSTGGPCSTSLSQGIRIRRMKTISADRRYSAQLISTYFHTLLLHSHKISVILHV